MDQLSDLFKLFGFKLETFVFVSGSVYLVIEWIKQKFPKFFIGGWKTELLALILSFVLACKACHPNWEAIAVLSVLCWIVPAGFHNSRKMRAKTS
jgi:hypothetical protein